MQNCELYIFLIGVSSSFIFVVVCFVALNKSVKMIRVYLEVLFRVYLQVLFKLYLQVLFRVYLQGLFKLYKYCLGCIYNYYLMK